MDDTDRMHECIAHRMGLPTKLPPEERIAARRTLTENVLRAVGKSALQGDAAAAKMLFDRKVLGLG